MIFIRRLSFRHLTCTSPDFFALSMALVGSAAVFMLTKFAKSWRVGIYFFSYEFKYPSKLGSSASRVVISEYTIRYISSPWSLLNMPDPLRIRDKKAKWTEPAIMTGSLRLLNSQMKYKIKPSQAHLQCIVLPLTMLSQPLQYHLLLLRWLSRIEPVFTSDHECPEHVYD